ncbi:MAG: FliI/YscN family ATPase [Sedimentisphaerales bacterium]|nr:FliI/YscN family ATPase [Sedimentisphaerales bacterium]
MSEREGQNNFKQRLAAVERTLAHEVQGRVAGLTGLTVEVEDFAVPVGAQCEIYSRNGTTTAESIGFRGNISVLMPLGEMEGISRGDRVVCTRSEASFPIGEQLLGRVIDGNGNPLDNQGPLLCQCRRGVNSQRLQPLDRTRIDTPLSTGIRSIDALLTCGQGQRMGIFSGPGVGKSVLLGMIARNTSADVTVIALVGERGREVREFIEKDLGPEGLRHSVVVASTSDEPAPTRVRASFVASSIAEYFRDQGKNVLLLMDSITRIAMAQRQIGLAIDEPPATKGFTPSVFSLLPRLVERSGKSAKGSITGFYTVLVEGDDLSEPISDTMRGLLDGHIWLSRSLANRNHYPAIDAVESISRVMPDVVDEEHQQSARDITRLIAVYRDIEDLVNIGAYAAGTSVELDLAVQAQPVINRFLQQNIEEKVTFAEALQNLDDLCSVINQVTSQPGNSSAGNSSANNRQQNQQQPKNKRAPLGLERMMAGL